MSYTKVKAFCAVAKFCQNWGEENFIGDIAPFFAKNKP